MLTKEIAGRLLLGVLGLGAAVGGVKLFFYSKRHFRIPPDPNLGRIFRDAADQETDQVREALLQMYRTEAEVGEDYTFAGYFVAACVTGSGLVLLGYLLWTLLRK